MNCRFATSQRSCTGRGARCSLGRLADLDLGRLAQLLGKLVRDHAPDVVRVDDDEDCRAETRRDRRPYSSGVLRSPEGSSARIAGGNRRNGSGPPTTWRARAKREDWRAEARRAGPRPGRPYPRPWARRSTRRAPLAGSPNRSRVSLRYGRNDRHEHRRTRDRPGHRALAGLFVCAEKGPYASDHFRRVGRCACSDS